MTEVERVAIAQESSKNSQTKSNDSSKNSNSNNAPPVEESPAHTSSVTKETDVTYLDDLKEVSFSVGYGVLGKHGLTGFEKTDVQNLRLKGDTPIAVKHGLSIVPKGTISKKLKQPGDPIGHVSYDLGKGFRVFRATAALNFPTREDGLEFALRQNWEEKAKTPLKFRVLGDAKLLWESRALQQHGDSQDCEVSIEGVDKLASK